MGGSAEKTHALRVVDTPQCQVPDDAPGIWRVGVMEEDDVVWSSHVAWLVRKIK